jgi:hypothetical protein
MTPTAPALVDLMVEAPVAVVHGGSGSATVTVLPEQEIGEVDGALRLYEDDRVVPGTCAQLHAFGRADLELGRLTPGWHLLTATYTGGSRYHCAASTPFSVLVLPARTVTDLVVPSAGVRPGDSLGVTVRTTDASAPACGMVSLYERARLVARGEVVDGVGTVIVPSGLAPGQHRLFAPYAGSATHSASETPVVPVTVRAG